ncbi:hypothetical protein KVP40.0226 [Vibrio phage KVP40]|uniref:Uncharacterized protein n=3 Tax=Schizotequatrovirus KVP40 TaxID=1914019 RepID=Q6WHS8_BPKVM|nr:hypothetical protein KVP40.0226 [Vibrio phage KVP40]AFN37456.1 hypothetical protein pp2_223 [Vibrio phage phi-pp2]QIW91188.1 hypothetical protein COHAPHLL_00352 [Vibrio phage V09]UNA01741.1 hypothetical protein [Vibrio phage PC-Liy1]URQ03037.1 hypothetical protein PVA8_51 [Vibrio phage PVA8]WBM58773.1 hypothetical protein vBValMPVA8_51 [Vibrio phage vB_ValM_PVA8]
MKAVFTLSRIVAIYAAGVMTPALYASNPWTVIAPAMVVIGFGISLISDVVSNEKN